MDAGDGGSSKVDNGNSEPTERCDNVTDTTVVLIGDDDDDNNNGTSQWHTCWNFASSPRNPSSVCHGHFFASQIVLQTEIRRPPMRSEVEMTYCTLLSESWRPQFSSHYASDVFHWLNLRTQVALTGLLSCCYKQYLNDKLVSCIHLLVSDLVAGWLWCCTCDRPVAGSNPGHCAVECNPGQGVYTHVPLSPCSIIVNSQWVVMLCGWQGNCRSGVALARHHRH